MTHARTRSAADGALVTGDEGPQVRSLQVSLDRLGYKDAHGRPLAVSGTFDVATGHAVRAFQLDHGLNAYGRVGPQTQKALRDATGQLVTGPAHPQHALYEQVLAHVRHAEHAKGTPMGPHSERIAAALTVELIREGVTHVDRVEFNRDDSLVRAVQVSTVRDESGLNRYTDAISVPQASMRSTAESSRQIHDVVINAQARQQDPQFAREPTPPVPPLGQ